MRMLVLIALAAAVSAQNCVLIVPPTPLTATGLATPYILKNMPGDTAPTCDPAQNANAAAFVQGAVIDVNTGNIQIYNPLVIVQAANAAPVPAAVTPTTPVLPAQSIVALWFGFNGGTLVLQDTAGATGLNISNCVLGVGHNSLSIGDHKIRGENVVGLVLVNDSKVSEGWAWLSILGCSQRRNDKCPIQDRVLSCSEE